MSRQMGGVMTDTQAAEAIARRCRRIAEARAEKPLNQRTYEVGALWEALAEMDRQGLTPAQYAEQIEGEQ